MGISTAGYIAIGLAGFGTAATLYSMDQQQQAAKAQSKANRKSQQLQQKRADVATARERAKQVRASRIARASALAQSTSGEATGGSGLAGVQANIGGSAAKSAQFLNQNQQISSEISNLNISTSRKVAKHTGRAAVGAGATAVAATANSLIAPE